MKKRNLITITVVIVLIAASCLWAAYTVSQSKLSGNVDRRAFDELNSSVTAQSAFFAKSLEQQYKSLESMAYYFGTLHDFNITNETAVTNACVLANDLCMLGYADLKGNAVSYEGESLGNIADRGYFIEASDWKGQRSIEYMATTARTSDPRILLAVPGLHDNALIAILFASKENEMFDEILLTDNFNGNEVVFITDSTGTIIARNENAHEHIDAANLFDDHTTENMLDGETAENIIANMRNGKSGSFCLNHREKEYVVYAPLGVSDWYLYSMVPSSTVNARVAANRQQFTDTIRTLAIAFCIAVCCIGVIAVIQLRHESRDKHIIRQQSERYQTILGSIRGAVFNYDMTSREIEVSDSFERMFGYTLPKTWAAEIPQRAIAHPELDYKALAEARSRIEVNLEQTETTICVDTETRGRRWFKVTLAPILNEAKHLVSIYGFIADVTEERDEYKRRMLDQERLTLAMSLLSPLVISVNLTQNSFAMVNYDNFTTKVAPKEGVFDELIEIGASTCPEPDNQRFVAAFSRESLLSAYARGEKKVELEHRQIGDDGVVRWMRTWVLFVNNPYDDDIY
ncbi:MAG: PAS domain S-box protein, partial [Methanocorpusculum sp.]|nr:PAS domain S-box protein [Methanocorpusculum sp.]